MRVLAFCLAAVLTACSADSDVAEQSKRDQSKQEQGKQREMVSYGIGYRMGSNMQRGEMDVDRDTLFQGMADALDEKTPKFSPQQIQLAITEYRQQQQEARLKLAEANEAAGRSFLQEHKQQADVIETPSGIQYRVIEEGEGEQPAASDTVKIHYRGRLINGEEFDSSQTRNEPTTLRVEQTIPGWQEVLPLMREGGKWEVVIPPRLAYDLRGAPPAIGPNETLIFELTLVEIVKPPVLAE